MPARRHREGRAAISQRRIVILDNRFAAYAEERLVLGGLGDIVVARPEGQAELQAAVRGADAVIINLYPLDAAAIAHLHGCQVISRYGIGFDNIDVPAATAAGIWVSTVPDYGWEDVSDHALALFLACVRKLTFADAAVRGGRWGAPRNKKSYRIRGKVFGLVGYGGIGRVLFRKLGGLGLERILVSDPYVPDAEIAAAGGIPADLATLLRLADFVSLHVPLSAATHHLIGAAQLQAMRPSAILINTSRGSLVDEAALAAALAEGTIAYAGLDVFEEEPLPTASPLAALDNVILSDHAAYYTEESLVELKTKAARNVREVFEGRPPVYPVNRIG